MTKRNVDRAVLAAFIVMAVLLYFSTANYTGIALKTSAKYVQFLAIAIGVLCSVQLIFNLVRDKSSSRLVITENMSRFIGLLAALVLFAILFEPLGFFIPAAVFIPVMAYFLGYRKPIAIGLTTIGVLLFVYLVFVQLLSVNLPGFNF